MRERARFGSGTSPRPHPTAHRVYPEWEVGWGCGLVQARQRRITKRPALRPAFLSSVLLALLAMRVEVEDGGVQPLG